MGYELWVSRHTGERRKGTGFLDFKKIFTEKITAKVIYEELVSFPANSSGSEAKQVLIERGFDSAGVVDDSKNVIGYVLTASLGEGSVNDYRKDMGRECLISDSTPLFEVFNVLRSKDFVYVNYADKIVGILSKADLNKPPVRIYIFGVVSLFEMHLSYWINHYFPEESWQNILSGNRIEKLQKVFEKRRENGMNQQLTMQECLQLCDKKIILLRSHDFIEFVRCSKKSFKKILESIESIRNNISHAQNSIMDEMTIDKISDALQFCEDFLTHSDEEVLKLAAR